MEKTSSVLPIPESTIATQPSSQLWKKISFIMFALLVILSIGSAFYIMNLQAKIAKQKNATVTPKACTDEAKVCPDGSSVGRTGSNCEFAECPEAPTSSQIPSNWKTYSNAAFSFKYPDLAEFQDQSQSNEGRVQVRVIYMGEEQRASGRVQTELGDGYMVTFSELEKASLDSLVKKRRDSTKATCPETVVMSPVVDVSIDSNPAKTYTVSQCFGDYTSYLVSHNGTIYEITLLYSGKKQADYKKAAVQVLSTFKFTDSSTSTNNVCPATDYVDCMPVVDSAKQKFCTAEYLKWAEKNCPGFKGAAY